MYVDVNFLISHGLIFHKEHCLVVYKNKQDFK